MINKKFYQNKFCCIFFCIMTFLSPLHIYFELQYFNTGINIKYDERCVIFLKIHKDNFKSKVPALPNPYYEPIIELTSNREAVIEGCTGIVEYNDCRATVNCKQYLVTFEGFDICLKSLSKDCISVKGRFNTISFTML